MNIIFGDSAAQQAQEKYIVLELDTFQVDEQLTTTYALVERVALMEMLSLDKFKDLHRNLMTEYRKRNWKYCEDAMEHLNGKWNGELDTFYTVLSDRIQDLKTQSLDDTWTGVILRSA
jgi:hypothetical protein